MTYSMKKSEKKRIKGLTSSNFCAIILPVSERNTMKNQMTMTEIRRHFEERRRQAVIKSLRARDIDERSIAGEDEIRAEARRDTFTLNGNTYEVSHDPKHQADQLAGYCGNNPK